VAIVPNQFIVCASFSISVKYRSIIIIIIIIDIIVYYATKTAHHTCTYKNTHQLANNFH